jgi:hypothetical protein
MLAMTISASGKSATRFARFGCAVVKTIYWEWGGEDVLWDGRWWLAISARRVRHGASLTSLGCAGPRSILYSHSRMPPVRPDDRAGCVPAGRVLGSAMLKQCFGRGQAPSLLKPEISRAALAGLLSPP